MKQIGDRYGLAIAPEKFNWDEGSFNVRFVGFPKILDSQGNEMTPKEIAARNDWAVFAPTRGIPAKLLDSVIEAKGGRHIVSGYLQKNTKYKILLKEMGSGRTSEISVAELLQKAPDYLKI